MESLTRLLMNLTYDHVRQKFFAFRDPDAGVKLQEVDREHPAMVTSWEQSSIQEIAEHPGVQIVTGDMCMWGVHLAEEAENQGSEDAVLVKKPTMWMTNSTLLANILSARCPSPIRPPGQGHLHSKLEGSNRTQQAAIYPKGFDRGNS